MRLTKPKGLKGNFFLKSQSGGFVYWQWTKPDGTGYHVITDRRGNLYEVKPWDQKSGRVEIMSAAALPKRYSYGGPKVKFEAWTYEVWGNRRDGYEVNNRFKSGTFSCDEGTWENDRTLKQLAKEILGIKKGVRLSSIDVEGDDMVSHFIYAPDGYPLGEFIRQA